MTSETQPADQSSVLLIRVNSSIELLNTTRAVDQVRRAFLQTRLVTLATPQTETRELLDSDRRFSEVLLFSNEADPQSKSVKAFRRFMGRQRIAATVVCFGATTGFDYSRHLLSVLACPGRRYLLDADGRLMPIKSLRAMRVLLGAAVDLGIKKITMPFLRKISRKRAAACSQSIPARLIRRILVIRLDHIGDVAMSLPAIHALKEHFSMAEIDVLAGSGAAPILQDVVDVNEVIVCDAPRFARDGSQQSLLERLALVRRLRRRRYDLAIDLRGDDPSRLWAMLSAAPRRAGPDFGPYEPPNQPNYSFLLTHPISAASNSSENHAVDAGLAVIRHLGVCVPKMPFRFQIAPEREEAVSQKRVEQGIQGSYAIVHVRPGNTAKTWNAPAFAKIIDHIVERHGIDVLLTGALRDKEANEQVLAQVRNKQHVYNAAGIFSLAELPVLFTHASLMVTVDSGPMHIAALVGTPIVSLFLPWSADNFHPYGQRDGVVIPSASDMKRREAEGRLWDGSLLDAIPTEEVCSAIDRKLGIGSV